MNIVEAIFSQCRDNPAELALAAPGTAFNVLSYGRLARCVNNICQRIISAGFEPGDRVAVFVDDVILHALLLLALTRMGIVTISGRNSTESWRFETDAVLTDRAFQSSARVVFVGAEWTTGNDRPPDSKYVHRAAPDDPCRIFLTSGSTGDEKAVALSHEVMGQRMFWQYMHFGHVAAMSSRVFVDMPLSTTIAFQLLISTLSRGGALLFPGDPQATMSALPTYRVQALFFAPSGLMKFFGAVESLPQYVCGCDAVWVGGGLVSTSMSERVRTRLCSDLTIAYGSTEAAAVASMPAQFAVGRPGAAGFVYPHISIEIVDDKDAPLPTGKEGVVRLKSKLAVNGYLADPEGSARVFRDGWFYPGDIGFLTQDRMLVISGRSNAVVNVGGEKINPEKIEEALLSHAAVADVAAFAVTPDGGLPQIHCLVVPRAQIDQENLRAHCATRMPREVIPASFIVVRAIPRNAAGKVERHKLADFAKSQLH